MNSCNLNENDNQVIEFISTSDETMQMVDEDPFSGPPWHQLPSPVVEKVYSFLSRKDQIGMSLVCRNWQREYSCPSLWRRMTFRFPDLENNTELHPDVVFARRHGHMFRHVEIVFNEWLMLLSANLRVRALLESVNQLKSFSQAVTTCNSQLVSISFKYLLSVTVFSATEREGICEEVFNLLNSQSRLRRVEFMSCKFEKEEAAKMLTVIFGNNYKTLRYLCLKQFHYDEQFSGITIDDESNFLALMNLEILDIHYTRTFVNMMLSFYEYRNRVAMRDSKGCLKEIKLYGFQKISRHLFPQEFDDLKIRPLVWKYFKKIFPALSVELTLSSECDTLNIFIVPEMPLKSLKFDLLSKQQEDIGSLLRHITSCELNKCLEKLAVIWKVISSNLASDLISFTNICPKLKALELEIQHPVAAEALDTVFNSWLENRPASLDVVKITVVAAKEKNIYARLNDIYAPLLQPKLNLSLLVRP